MAGSDDSTLIKVAIFGITISLFCTLGVSLMLVETGDYDYDDIQAYRNELISFSGEAMLNENPWVLTHVYTPWNAELDPATHYEDGWLYGEDVEYSEIGKAADIRMDKNYKSSVPITFETEAATYMEQSGTEWWAGIPVINWIGENVGLDPYTYKTVTANNWNYTGYRYVLDPTLPFSNNTSTVDGSLSLVWYSFNGTEGLSGGLDIYGGEIKLASYTAYDIVSTYNTTSGYASTYDFDFGGTHLTLSVKFDPVAIEGGKTLLQAWTDGDWSFAISSLSAGNFLDIENSNSYSTSVGSMLDTFIQIFTFNVPDLNNEWAGMILWMLCGLPMTIAMLCVTMRVIQAIKPL